VEPHGIRRIQFNCYKVKEADWVGGDNGVGNPSAKAMAELGKPPTLLGPWNPDEERTNSSSTQDRLHGSGSAFTEVSPNRLDRRGERRLRCRCVHVGHVA
jgi:hypothetical protein